jgi:hypothetical protein
MVLRSITAISSRFFAKLGWQQPLGNGVILAHVQPSCCRIPRAQSGSRRKAMRRTAKHLAILLVSAVPLVAGPAAAQSQPGGGFNTFAPIQCAGASDLCAWKRKPGAGGWQGFESRPIRPMKRPKVPPR